MIMWLVLAMSGRNVCRFWAEVSRNSVKYSTSTLCPVLMVVAKSQEGAPFSLGPQVTMIPTCNRQAGRQEADLSCFNHRDVETVLLKQNLSHLSSQRSASSLGFFFTPVTFVNSDWLGFQCVSHILLLIPLILISLPSHPSGDLFLRAPKLLQFVGLLQAFKPWP